MLASGPDGRPAVASGAAVVSRHATTDSGEGRLPGGHRTLIPFGVVGPAVNAKTLTVEAVGRRVAVPEVATVEALAVGEGASAEGARATARDRAATLRESVRDASSGQIRTTDLQVRDADELFDAVTDAPFQATERLHVDCAPADAASVAVDVTDAGGQVQSVEFRLHEARRRELQNEAVGAAVERAREKAERMAAAEGLAVAGLREARTTEANAGPEGIVDEALASSPDTDLHPEPVTVAEAVEAVFALDEE